jgi:hypothetical protein
MQRNKAINPARAVLVCIALCALVMEHCGQIWPNTDFRLVNRRPDIFPFSHGTVIPPNIAPLNFVIREQGESFFVSFSARGAQPLAISSRTPSIAIPSGKWKEMLSRERGQAIGVDVFCSVNKVWRKYQTVWDTVATDSIDPFVAYRKIPVCEYWNAMGMYQRDVQDFTEEIVFQNKSNNACFNCHSFWNNSPARMAVEVRSRVFGTPMVLGRITNDKYELRAVNTKTPFSSGKVGFTSWHPDGTMIAFSMNRFEMLYYSAGAEPRAVFDGAADMALFDVAKNEISSSPELSRKDRIKTMPEWSRDGRFLYFCSAEKLPESRFRDIRCDLMRIGFDPQARTFGRLDTVLTAQQAGGSVLQPRMSPDGRFILVNIARYGDFPIDKAGTRLGIIDVTTSALRTPDSDCRWTDSWHGWSSSGRWIVFTSKRLNGRFSAICFRYVDSSGAMHDPFVLPQKDPSFYESSIFAFTVPECLTARIPVTISQCRAALRKYGKKPGEDAVTAASARQGAYGDN